MKRISIAIILLVLIPALSKGQEETSKPGTETNNPDYNRPSQMVAISQMDQRRIYNWRNGQRATPAGRQAGDRRAKFARVIGDSAIVIYDWAEKLKAGRDASVKN